MHALPNLEYAPVVNLFSQNVILRGFSLLTAGRVPLKFQEEIVTHFVKNTLPQQLGKDLEGHLHSYCKKFFTTACVLDKIKVQKLVFSQIMVYITQESVTDTSTPKMPI